MGDRGLPPYLEETDQVDAAWRHGRRRSDSQVYSFGPGFTEYGSPPPEQPVASTSLQPSPQYSFDFEAGLEYEREKRKEQSRQYQRNWRASKAGYVRVLEKKLENSGAIIAFMQEENDTLRNTFRDMGYEPPPSALPDSGVTQTRRSSASTALAIDRAEAAASRKYEETFFPAETHPIPLVSTPRKYRFGNSASSAALPSLPVTSTYTRFTYTRVETADLPPPTMHRRASASASAHSTLARAFEGLDYRPSHPPPEPPDRNGTAAAPLLRRRFSATARPPLRSESLYPTIDTGAANAWRSHASSVDSSPTLSPPFYRLEELRSLSSSSSDSESGYSLDRSYPPYSPLSPANIEPYERSRSRNSLSK